MEYIHWIAIQQVKKKMKWYFMTACMEIIKTVKYNKSIYIILYH